LWNPDSGDGRWEDNTALLRFFTGRVHPTQDEQDRGAIDDELWGTYIDVAEKLLICAHTSAARTEESASSQPTGSGPRGRGRSGALRPHGRCGRSLGTL